MRILHTMLRVGDLQRSIDFYTRVLGMTLLRKSENSEYKYTLAFVGYGDEKDEAVIELTYNWGVSEYELGSAYGHMPWKRTTSMPPARRCAPPAPRSPANRAR